MTRVGVIGARGRMGSAAVRAIEASADLEVVAAVDAGDDIGELAVHGAEAALVFSTPEVALEHVDWCVHQAIPVVVGTSGFDDERLARLRETLGPDPTTAVLVVPNFSVGAVLLMQFAARAAPYFESVEVVEMHHPDKVDAPSGTATRTAELVADARRAAGSAPMPDATTTDPAGARGARIDGISVHAIRARGFVASQEVVLGGPGETLTVRHDSHDRGSFMPGVLTALRAVGDLRGLTVGLDPLL